MKKVNIILFFTFCYCFSSFAQHCACEKDFEFIVNKIENNHPGFNVNVTKNNRAEYNAWKSTIREEIANDDTKCVKLLNKYLSFIKDKHLRVYSPQVVDEAAYEKKLFTVKIPKLTVLDRQAYYVKVPSFNSRLWRELDHFYDSITPIVKDAKYLIVDIRNNGGGGERMYNQLLKIIRKEVPGQVMVLFNRKCASACEEVALKVSNMKNVVTMGENTNGQFAYGFIKGLKTPSCGLTFIITTKKYPKRLKYEYVGVAPSVKIAENEDWIEAALKYVDNK